MGQHGLATLGALRGTEKRQPEVRIAGMFSACALNSATRALEIY